MKTMKRVLAVLLAMMMMAALVACGGDKGSSGGSTGGSTGGESTSKEETYIWRIGHNNADTHQWQVNLLKLVDLAAEKSGGRLVIETYPNSQLGDDTAMAEMIRNGNLDMMVTGGAVAGRWYNPVNLMETPYVFDDIDHCERAIYGEPGKIMNEGLAEAGINVYDYWLRANRQIMSKTPINSLEDMKNLKIRVPETDTWVRSMNGLGANPTPVAFSEAFTALQQGVVDAIENPLSSMYNMRFQEVCPCLALTNHVVSCSTILYNKDNHDKLPEDLQAILRECMDEIREYNNEITRDEDQVYIDMIKEEYPDYTVTTPDYEEFAEAGRAALPEIIAACEGEELYEAIRALA